MKTPAVLDGSAEETSDTNRPIHVIGRMLDDNGQEQLLDPRSRVRMVGTVDSGDAGWGRIWATVFLSKDVEDRAGVVFDIQTNAHQTGGFVPYVQSAGARLILHLAGESEVRNFLKVLGVASALALRGAEQAVSDANSLGVGLALPAASDLTEEPATPIRVGSEGQVQR